MLPDYLQGLYGRIVSIGEGKPDLVSAIKRFTPEAVLVAVDPEYSGYYYEERDLNPGISFSELGGVEYLQEQLPESINAIIINMPDINDYGNDNPLDYSVLFKEAGRALRRDGKIILVLPDTSSSPEDTMGDHLRNAVNYEIRLVQTLMPGVDTGISFWQKRFLEDKPLYVYELTPRTTGKP